MKEENKMSIDDMEKLEEVDIEVSKDATSVNEGVCPSCNKRMLKYIDNKNLFDGTLTLHIIKFKCLKCKKEFLDLEEAQNELADAQKSYHQTEHELAKTEFKAPFDGQCGLFRA